MTSRGASSGGDGREGTWSPQRERRLIEWLRAHHPQLSGPDVLDHLRLLDRLEAGRLEPDGVRDEAHAEGLPGWLVDRLSALHAACREFDQAQPEDPDGIEWAGPAVRPHGADEVEWVGATPEPEHAPPEGPAPSLLPPRARRRRSGARPRFTPSDLVVPLVAAGIVAGGLLLARVERGRTEAVEARADRAQWALTSGPAVEVRSRRVARQAAVSEYLSRLEGRRRELVNSLCEGGDACRQRLEVLDRRLRLIAELADDAVGWSVPGEPEPRWRPPSGFLAPVIGEIDARLADAATPAELRPILAAERELLHGSAP